MKIHNRQGTYMEVDTREVKQEQFKQRPKLELRAYRQRQRSPVTRYPYGAPRSRNRVTRYDMWLHAVD